MSTTGGGEGAGGLADEARVLRRFGAETLPFWRGATAPLAWRLTIGVTLAAILIIGVNLGVNRWNGWFFDALEKRDGRTAGVAVAVFPLLVAGSAAAGVFMVYCRESVQVRWREFIVRALMARWLSDGRYQRLGALGVEPANPEYRIADDVRMAIEPLVDLYIGVVSSVLTGVTFYVVLWRVGGAYTLTIGDAHVSIPAFMVIAATVYGVATSTLALLLGRSLVRKVGRRNEAEARLRFGLSRVRENASAVARAQAAAQERQGLERIYDLLAARWMEVVRTNANLTWITNSHGVLVLALPLILATPKYLDGGLSLGDVVALGSAFVQVQLAIGWFADNIKLLAPSVASMRRVVELTEAMDAADPPPPAEADGGEAGVRFADATLRDQQGRPLLHIPDFAVARGETALLLGETGAGKSIFAMALAGHWPRIDGAAQHAPGRRLALTQRAYLPAGSVRDMLVGAGRAGAALSDAALRDALAQCDLSRLRDALDATGDEAPALSDGERRRLAFARALVMTPDLLVLDDALGGLDAALVVRLFAALRAAQPHIIVVMLAPVEPAWLPSGVARWRFQAGADCATLRPEARPTLKPCRDPR